MKEFVGIYAVFLATVVDKLLSGRRMRTSAGCLRSQKQKILFRAWTHLVPHQQTGCTPLWSKVNTQKQKA